MNVFDFDQTIYRGDSTRDFIIFCMRRHPKALCYLPYIGIVTLAYYLFRIGTKTQYKEKVYRILKACDTKRDVELFWENKLCNIKAFFYENRREGDLVISASPEFLLKPLEKKLNIRVIASRVSAVDGTTDGENCYHQEKVRRYREECPEGEIDCFYSDSYADEPLALLAKKAYLVDGERLIEWDYQKHKKNLRT